MRKGATEEDLLELIGKAVSNKHAKHAGMKNLVPEKSIVHDKSLVNYWQHYVTLLGIISGMLNLAKMENRPMILIGG